MAAQQSCGYRMKRATPHLATERTTGEDSLLARIVEHFVDTSQHFGGCPAGKGEQQDPRWINSFVNQVRHTMNERARLAGTRAGNQ
jgi:hypothetical protein